MRRNYIKSKKRMTLFICLLILPILAAAWFYIAYAMPHYVDKEAFKLVGIPYDSKRVEFKYAQGYDMSLAYVSLTKAEARAVSEKPPALFGICENNDMDDVQCTSEWVPASSYKPNKYLDMPVHDKLYLRVLEGDVYCSYATASLDDQPLSKDDLKVQNGTVVSFVYDYMCINRSNGLFLYMRLRS